MRSRKSSRWIELALTVLAISCGGAPSAPSAQGNPAGQTASSVPGRLAVLVFSKTEGFRHDSIPAGVAAIREQGRQRGFSIEPTEDAATFTDDGLAKYGAIVFLSTTGDVLNPAQQEAFERFIRRGGGFVGIHSAADTEYDWPFYGALMGAYFAGHPDIQSATVRVEASSHPSMTGLPSAWSRRDEWYNFQKNPRGTLNILATLDERTYNGGTMGSDHPIVWSHGYEGGRAFYTAGGHSAESYSEPLFAAHLGNAIVWAGGK
jgi:type 1 glutamine amidotransferase